ncbi:MAG: hypothetical protein HY824_10430, partial [Acidobacteria bacterium]|nr:hypothetical protein [Acidobacteriota bacterium]
MRKLFILAGLVAFVAPLLAQGQGGGEQRGVLGPVGALGQEVVKRTPPSTEPPPRLPDGTIDLNGVWV